MSETGTQKIQVSVKLTSRTETAISAEAKRLGISFGDMTRRITDRWVDEWTHAQEKPPERIVVLDRAKGELRAAR